MAKYMYLTYRFLICLLLKEFIIFRQRISYYNFFFSNINLLKYIFYLFDKDINPLKSNEFLKFIKLNKKKWTKVNKNKIIDTTKEVILIESFLNHPGYTLGNVIVGKYLQLFYRSQCIGLLRKGDIKAEVIFRSFGINKFYYYKIGSFYQRCKYIYKSIIILKDIKNVKKFCKIKLKKIDIGLTSYDTFMRYTRNPTSKKVNFKLILFFAEALYANDFFEKIFHNSNITKLVQSECQFIPLNILFQKALIKKKKIYAKFGKNKIFIRIFTNFNQRYKFRGTFSKDLFDEVFNRFKAKSIKIINRYYKKKIEKKFYGQEIEWQQSKLLAAKISNKKSLSKLNLCKMFNWNKKKKIATIFLHILIDGNYHYGRRNLFLDNYTWTKYTLETIKKIKNINWIIKQHPSEHFYNSKFDSSLLVKDLEKKYDHIRLFPENLNPISLTKFTDVIITSHGTVGVEYPAFGIPSIVAENSRFSNFGFTLVPKNIVEYKNLLKKTHKIKKLNKKKIEKAKVFLFIANILLMNKLSIIPDHTTSKLANENKFWYQSNQNLRKFNLNNDQFKIMLKKQLYLKLRHTVNFDLCSIKNKKLNDY